MNDGFLKRQKPDPDIIPSGKTPIIEESISNHPTIKPQQWLRILVRSLLPLGKGKVLDPFCGSGSTIAACQAVEYDAIGVEIDEEYFSLLTMNIHKLSALYPKYKGETLELPAECLPIKSKDAWIHQESLL